MKHPRHGGRILFEREEVGEARVRYRVTLYAPDAEWRTVAAIDVADGGIELGTWEGEGEPPAWLADGARAFLRTVWSARKREDDPAWPRRLLRWREPR